MTHEQWQRLHRIGEVTNQRYADLWGIARRQASKVRSGRMTVDEAERFNSKSIRRLADLPRSCEPCKTFK